jgi:hypothetical protein
LLGFSSGHELKQCAKQFEVPSDPKKGAGQVDTLWLTAKPENWVGSVTSDVPSGKSCARKVLSGTETMYEWD